MTGQRAQTRLAASSRESRAAVGSLEGAKNRPASSRRHTASVCQGASWSLSRAGSRWAGAAATCRDECGGCSTGLLLTTASRARDDAARPTRCARAYAQGSRPPDPPLSGMARSRPSTVQVFAQTLVDLVLNPIENVRDELAPLRSAFDVAQHRPPVDVDHGRVGLGRIERVHLEVAEHRAAGAAQRDVLRDADLDVAEDRDRLDHDLLVLEERLGEVDLDGAEDGVRVDTAAR